MKTWTESEILFLKKHYANMETKIMAQAMNKKPDAVNRKASLLGIHKSKKFLSETIKRNGIDNNTFKKGMVPWNKNKTGLTQLGGAHKFRKGNIPHTYKEVGYESVRKDGYIFIKTESGFKPKQQYIYEQNFGEIPRNHIVIFKDNNKYNFDIDNLELISRSENMKRNSIWNMPEELKEVVILKKTLMKIINGKEQNQRPTQPPI